MNGLRIGVLGCADIAVRRVLPALVAMPDVHVTVIASRDLAKATTVTSLYGGKPVHGYAAVLDRDDVDAVYIPLPVALRPHWIGRALLAGKHVLAEKPVTAKHDMTARLFALARERGLALMENIMFVTHSQHVRVRRLLDEGVIGELRSFHSTFSVPRLPAGDIRYQRELGGGGLLDVGIYPVRAAMYFLGKLDVVGAVLTADPRRKVDTSGAALLGAHSGIPAQVTFGIEHMYLSAYELRGDRGRIVVDPAFTPPADHQPVIRLERPGGWEQLREPPTDQVTATLARFVSATRAGRSVDEAACLHLVALLEAVRDHAATATGMS